MAANLQVVGKEGLGFDDFWQAYPRKQARKDALKAWSHIDSGEYPKILRAIELAKRTEQWTKDHGQYIPMPASWLRGERWYDEYEITVAPVTPSGQVKDARCQQFEGDERCREAVAFWGRGGTKGNCRKHGPY